MDVEEGGRGNELDFIVECPTTMDRVPKWAWLYEWPVYTVTRL